MSRLRAVVLVFSISFLAACGGSSEEPPSTLQATDDSVQQGWSPNVQIDVLANDVFPEGTKLSLVSDPAIGSIEIDNDKVVFTPPETEVETSLHYLLTAPDGRTSRATVTIKLMNQVVNAQFDANLLPAIETQILPLKITTLLPLSDGELNVTIHQSGTGDAEQGTLVLIVPTDQTEFEVAYEITENHLNYFGAEVEQTLELSIHQNETMDDFSFDYTFTNTPPKDYLRQSFRKIWFSESGSRAIVDRNELFLSWTSFAPWDIPEQPTWREDPYNNRTWLLYYHSLAWLHAYEYKYAESGDEAYLTKLISLVNDYIGEVSPDTYFKMAWDDHTIAARADTLVFLYHSFVRTTQSAEVKQAWLDYLEVHAQRLDNLLRDSHFDSHNHGLIHATSLYSMTFAIPELSNRVTYRQNSLDRMEQLFGNMVNLETGLSIEQSANYQLVALEMFSGVTRLLKRMEGAAPEKLFGYLSTMVDFTSHWIYSGGGAPAVGDANYGAVNYLSRLTDVVNGLEIESEYFAHIDTGGVEGTPLEQQYLSAEDGYVISRPNYAIDETEVYLFNEFGKYYFSHGHHDATNVIFAVDGKSILVDSAGPYLYNSERRYFQSAHGHNVLVVDDALSFKKDAELLGATCELDLCISYGRTREVNFDSFRLNIVAKLPLPRLYVLDIARSSAESTEDHLFELNWHFPPESVVSLPDSGGECLAMTTPWASNWCMYVDSSNALAIELYEGFDDGEKERGWVQPKFGTKVPAPHVIYSDTSEQFVAFTSLLPAHAESRLTGAIVNSGDNIELNIGTHTIDITALHSDAPVVSITRH